MATEQDKRPQGGNAVMQLLQFAGSRRWLAFAGSALAAVNGILTVVPLVLVWFVLRDFVAVAPHFEEATDATLWAWLAFGAAVLGALCYFAGLMLTHTAAFRVAANMRKACLAHVAKVPLGYFDANASGRLRRIIDGCAGQTEDVIAHKMPDFIASITAPVAYLVAMFLFDWVMGLVCLIPVAVSLFAMWWMMGRDVPEGGRYFMQRYQEALNRMSTAATEYVRGIPVVKVFQQTVHSFRAFHAAIVDYRDMATNYVNFCRLPQVVQLTAINGTFVVLVPAAILLAAGAGDFGRFLTDFLFYVIFSAFTTTVMSKVMYSSEALMMAEDSMRRVNEILAVAPMEEVAEGAAARWRAWCRAFGIRRRAWSRWAAPMCGAFPLPSSWTLWPSCSKTIACSRAPWPTTSAWGAPMPATRTWPRRPGRPSATTSSRSSPRGLPPAWARTACTCRAGSASASRSPAPF